MRRAVLGLLILILFTGGSCAVHEADLAWPEKRPLGASLPTTLPPSDPDALAQRQKARPPSILTLRQALALTLLHNPELVIFAREVRVNEAEVLQASLGPNPQAEVAVEDLLGSGELSGVQQLQLTVQLSQLVELGGKRTARLAVARGARSVAGWDYEIKRLDVLTTVSKVFTDVLSSQEGLRAAEEMVQLATEMQRVFAEKVRAGQVSPLELSRGEVMKATALMDLSRQGQRLAGHRQVLAALWGNERPAFRKVIGTLHRVETVPSLSELSRRLAGNPHLARWAAVYAHRRSQVELEEARAVPDLTVQAGYRYLRAVEASAMVMGMAIPLPLFDRNQGSISAARHRLAQAREEQHALRVTLARGLARAYQRLATAQQEATMLQDKVLPVAKRLFFSAQEGYRIGRFTYLEVLDAQKTWFEARQRYLQGLATYHKAVADLEQLLGAPLRPRREG